MLSHRFMLISLGLVAVLSIAGCVTTLGQYTFHKSGGTDEEWNRDTYECRRDNPSELYGSYASWKKMMLMCMRARGYVIKAPDGSVWN